MHVKFNYDMHRNILQFQYEYFFKSFTVTSPILLFLDLYKHTFNKTEAMQLSTGNTLNIWILFHITNGSTSYYHHISQRFSDSIS